MSDPSQPATHARLAAYAHAEALTADPRAGTRRLANTALGALGIELLECTAATVIARMPAPDAASMGTLYVLAESVASTAAGLAVATGRRAFGAELNAATLVNPEPGYVMAQATPLALGDALHVWAIEIVDEQATLILEGRCTLGVVDAPTATPFAARS